MKRTTIAAVIMLVALPAAGQGQIAPSQASETDTQRGKEREATVDAEANRQAKVRLALELIKTTTERLEADRYAVLLESDLQTGHELGVNSPTHRFAPWYRQAINAHDGDRFHYEASNKIVTNGNALINIGQPFTANMRVRQTHFWKEMLVARDLQKMRMMQVHGPTGPFAAPQTKGVPYKIRRPDQELSGWVASIRGGWSSVVNPIPIFRPLETFLGADTFQSIGHPHRLTELKALRGGKLERTEIDERGVITSYWSYRHADYTEAAGVITHDPAIDYLPRSVSWKTTWRSSKLTDQQHSLYYNLDSKIELAAWRKVRGYWLPHAIRYDQTRSNGQVIVKLRWAVGSQLPDVLFDPQTEDSREPMMEFFARPWARIVDGYFEPVIYEPPTGNDDRLNLEVAQLMADRREAADRIKREAEGLARQWDKANRDMIASLPTAQQILIGDPRARVASWVSSTAEAAERFPKERYAVLAEGLVADSQQFASAELHIAASNGALFNYMAEDSIHTAKQPVDGPSIAELTQTHLWRELLRQPTCKVRDDSDEANPVDGRYRTPPPGANDQQVARFVYENGVGQLWNAQLCPYHMVLGFPSKRIPAYITFSQIMNKSVLDSVEVTPIGQVKSYWRHDKENEITMWHDPASGYMPVRVIFSPKRMHTTREIEFQDWRHIAGYWLPHRVHQRARAKTPPHRAAYDEVFRLHWALSGDAPDELFNPDTPDHRLPILLHFGQRDPEHYVPMVGLYAELEKQTDQ